ncbi:hypothetical protein ACEPAH_7321 [Sanghuangporus vaninii]
MSNDIVYVAHRDPVQYRPGVPRGSRGALKEDREGNHAREIELKRSRGEISCAECRRLKIKCDRQLPCSSCMRRGCASLCPNGSLATGQGTRFVLAATDHLHRRMSKMSERIRQLEDALAIMQSNVSQESHPLLRDELLSLKVDKPQDTCEPDPVHDPPKGLDGLGTLSITDKGQRFFGASGGPELMFLKSEDDERLSSPSLSGSSPISQPSSSSQASKSPHLQPELTLFSNSFPFTPIGPVHEVQQKIKSYLPSWDDAVRLANVYLEHAAWLFHSVTRDQLLNDMLPAIYHHILPEPSHGNPTDYEGPHALACLFMVFAMGTLVDLRQEPYSAEADHYYQLAKAAVALQNIFEQPNIVTIQTLHLMSIYNGMREPAEDYGETSMEMSWSLIRVCMQLALTIGLHRDSARWGLGRLEVERRRVLFWDLYTADSWQSLSTGRPPCVTLPYIDCQFPRDEDARLDEKGKQEPGFNKWVFGFVCDCVGEVASKTLTATVPSYTTILDLDAKIRDFNIPSLPDIPLDPSRPAAVMAHFVQSHSREAILMNLHRSFFAQAMIDDPVNPLRSQYAPSFLATYRTAAHILKTIREQFEIIPEFASRFWMPWTYAFSSAVVFGTIVVRGPSSSYAPSSLQELDKACELFSAASQRSRRAAKASAILDKLKAKAHSAYESCLRSRSVPDLHGGDVSMFAVSKQEPSDELDLISGRVRLLSSKRGSSVGGSPSANSLDNKDQTPSPPPSYSKASPTKSNGPTLRLSEMENPLLPLANTVSAGLQMHNMSSVRSPDSTTADTFFPLSAAWVGSGGGSSTAGYRDAYAEHGQDPSGSYAMSTGSYPTTVKLDEWVPSPTSRTTQTNSHSSHPDIGMDGMEYGHGSTGVSSHHNFVPHSSQSLPQSLGHSQAHEQSLVRTFQPRPPSHLDRGDPRYHAAYPTPSSNGTGTYYLPSSSGGTPPELYATAPRELAEMGLASQHSGINQRWTSFMQDTGLFYPQHGTSM